MGGTEYLGLNILIGGSIAIARFNKIRREYYPFIFIIWLACINELITFYCFLFYKYNTINSNIYGLLEGLLYLWFFRAMGAFRRLSFLPYLLSFLFLAMWIGDNFVRSGHNFTGAFNSYYQIFYSLTLVLLAITMVNNILVAEKEVLRNSAFLICIGVIVFFTYISLVEAFWVYGVTGMTKSKLKFTMNVFEIVGWINLFSNLIFALAILWMRKRQEFTVQF